MPINVDSRIEEAWKKIEEKFYKDVAEEMMIQDRFRSQIIGRWTPEDLYRKHFKDEPPKSLEIRDLKPNTVYRILDWDPKTRKVRRASEGKLNTKDMTFDYIDAWTSSGFMYPLSEWEIRHHDYCLRYQLT